MIILKKIKLTNFLSHKKTEINFNPSQKLLIDGASGSGKSSIVEGLVWTFYGKGRSNNTSLIKKGTPSATVEVFLKNEKEEYKISRSISNKGRHSLSIYEFKDKKFVPIKSFGIKDAQSFLEKDILNS